MKNRILYTSIIINALFIVLLILLILYPDNDANSQNLTNVDIRKVLEKSEINFLASKLTNENYYQSSNIHSYQEIKKDLSILDSLYPNKIFEIRGQLYSLLTDTLVRSLSVSQDDSTLINLSRLQNFSIKYFYYSQTANNIDDIAWFRAVSDFWGQYVANRLSDISQKDIGRKADFRYRYLETNSNTYRFGVNTKTYSIEKVVKNILDYKWSHLFNASWNQATIFQKILFAMIFLITIISYIIAAKKVKSYIRN
jgi:hypothetical protein